MTEEAKDQGPPVLPAFDPSIRVIFEHTGGPLDGLEMSSDSEHQEEANWVRIWYVTHNRGEVGKAFKGLSPFVISAMRKHGPLKMLRSGLQSMFGMHKYEIVERVEEGNTVRVRYQYRGRD